MKATIRAIFSVFFGATSVVCGCSSSDGPEPIEGPGELLAGEASTASALSLGGNPFIGAVLFFNEFPGTEGNGRVCATCHVAEDGFQLTPGRVESRWQALQARKRRHPDADDPLFRSIDADDLAEDFSLLREHALVRVVIPLPKDAQGYKLVWPVDDPGAESVEVFRATPTIRNSLSVRRREDGAVLPRQQRRDADRRGAPLSARRRGHPKGRPARGAVPRSPRSDPGRGVCTAGGLPGRTLTNARFPAFCVEDGVE